MGSRTKSLAAAAALTALAVPAGPAGATEARAFSIIDGHAVGVGDAVGSGVPNDGTCTFTAPVGVTAVGGVTVTLAMTDDCTVYVDDLGTSQRAAVDDRHATWKRSPAVRDDLTIASDGSWSAVNELVRASQDPLRPREAVVQEEFYDELGVEQFFQWFRVSFTRNMRTGALGNAYYGDDSFCSVNPFPTADLLGVPYQNDTRGCFKSMPQSTPNIIQIRGTGWYDRSFLNETQFEVRSRDTFVARRSLDKVLDDEDFDYSCVIEYGAIPRTWRKKCAGLEYDGLAAE